MYKKQILAAVIIGSAFIFSLFADSLIFVPLTPNATNVQANSTNSTAGTIAALRSSQEYATIWFSGDTQASSSSGNIICEVSRASGTDSITNAFDTTATMPSTTGIRLTMTPNGAGTWVSSDTINLYGVKYLRVGRIMNQTGGPISNIVVNVGIMSGSIGR